MAIMVISIVVIIVIPIDPAKTAQSRGTFLQPSCDQLVVASAIAIVVTAAVIVTIAIAVEVEPPIGQDHLRTAIVLWSDHDSAVTFPCIHFAFEDLACAFTKNSHEAIAITIPVTAIVISVVAIIVPITTDFIVAAIKLDLSSADFADRTFAFAGLASEATVELQLTTTSPSVVAVSRRSCTFMSGHRGRRR